MDQFMIDASDCGRVRQGDEVEIIGKRFTAEDMARALNTVSYEVVCKISERVKKIFIN